MCFFFKKIFSSWSKKKVLTFRTLKVDDTIAVLVCLFHHEIHFFIGQIHSDTVHRRPQLLCIDGAIPVQVKYLEGLAQIAFLVERGPCGFGPRRHEADEFIEIKESVPVEVEFAHDAVQLRKREARSKSVQETGDFLRGYGPISILVKREGGERERTPVDENLYLNSEWLELLPASNA